MATIGENLRTQLIATEKILAVLRRTLETIEEERGGGGFHRPVADMSVSEVLETARNTLNNAAILGNEHH